MRPCLASVASIFRTIQSTEHLEVSRHNFFDKCFVRGEISLHANNRKTLIPLKNKFKRMLNISINTMYKGKLYNRQDLTWINGATSLDNRAEISG